MEHQAKTTGSGLRTITVTCARGAAPGLAAEIAALGFPVTRVEPAAVQSRGTFADTLALNLRLRTGQRVLWLLAEFPAPDADALYARVHAIPWEQEIPADGYLSVTSAVHHPAIRDTRFANLKCKDAIVDRLREACGRRPDAGASRDRTVVFLYWQPARAKVYLDTTGEPLSRRGYRRLVGAAPMQESLAAAAILATGWTGDGHFINPMCGSGTLAIEAVLLALHRAPGLTRTNFGFMHTKRFDPAAWQALVQEARRQAKPALDFKIIATDRDAAAVADARRNAEAAGVAASIQFGVGDFRSTPLPAGGPGVIMFNPEYGERLGAEQDLVAVYRGIGDFLKQRGAGYRGYVFTGNFALAKQIGLRSRRRLPFFNGDLECRLLEYDLYAGAGGGRIGTEPG